MLYLLVKACIDLALWLLAAVLAFGFRQPSAIDSGVAISALPYLAVTTAVMAVVSWYYHLARQSWQRASLLDLVRLAQATGLTTLLVVALAFILQPQWHLPRSVPVLAGVLGLVLMGAARMLTRLLYERRPHRRAQAKRRVLIVGAGEAGTLIAKEMQRHPEAGLTPIGFLDDEVTKQRRSIVGLPVFGPVGDLVAVARREQAAEILIAVPSAPGDFVRRVVQLAQSAEVRYRIIPGVFEILAGNVGINEIREVNLEDLLRREPVHLNTAEIAGYLRGRVVLVTGAGGSIGSEIVRQLCPFGPAKVLLFGRGENSVFGIQQELEHDWPEIQVLGLIGDVRDDKRLRAIFREYQPEVVFHAAAHKHVPLMEQSPSEAVLNNIFGTRNVVQCCLDFGVQRLVNISTDKAVNPTSVMGASKRVAEMVVSAGAAQAKAHQAFVSVRFGNVLGSRGSVVPIFMKQILAGGPVTVTHPEMVRYFMTIPEAARLVLQAGGLAENGKVYVLNMGEPVKIADLARDLIHLSGASHVDIVYSGVRPGEKLYEELLTTSEETQATTHQEIFSAQLQQCDPQTLETQLSRLGHFAAQGDARAIRAVMMDLIPENKFGSLR
ncbi:polysaccharide biosynthesis protein [Deinococcus multiflagellatus]|uniref:Polysaccharide biosynthesis protein n=1 Tax=Deinococcus multiflagellatus TaxID=1656887 RepID=A0ABW1ZN72_9DEIO|nr:nucleoside-diphosphate sugar epimerase/dehydratase [Deinococcus multiflagellatus]MBZ9714116.1 polysaccharide biosynthesis protein [Deinococcus multiflagellatus]